jgi:hypothetical protein
MDNRFIIKNGFVSKNDSIVSGSLDIQAINSTSSLFLIKDLNNSRLFEINKDGIILLKNQDTIPEPIENSIMVNNSNIFFGSV